MSSRQPRVWSSGASGWIEANSGQLMGSISAAALSFMVQEPSGIMVRSRARSLSARERSQRIIAVSERCSVNTGWVR
jgi:hypothetical protein